MGFSGGKPQSESGLEWVIAGIPLRAPLKPIYTVPAVERESSEIEDCSSSSTTPTSSEARIPARLKPPPAPRKRKASLKCNYRSREFFNPPDLETVFIRHIERAN